MSELVFHNGRYLPRIIVELFPDAHGDTEGKEDKQVREVFTDSVLTCLHKPNAAKEANALTLLQPIKKEQEFRYMKPYSISILFNGIKLGS